VSAGLRRAELARQRGSERRSARLRLPEPARILRALRRPIAHPRILQEPLERVDD